MTNPSYKHYGRLSDAHDKYSEIIWDESRKPFHEELVSKAVAEGMRVAELMKHHVPGIYCMRGNTAAGKTTAIRQGMIEELEVLLLPQVKDLTFAAINPDAFKVLLIEKGKEDGHNFTHADVHPESSDLARQTYELMLKQKVIDNCGVSVPASIVVDKRMANSLDEIRVDYFEKAKESHRKLFIFDIDCPLAYSLMGVLKREPKGESPIPPFDVVAAGGYAKIVSRRKDIIDFWSKEPNPSAFNASWSASPLPTCPDTGCPDQVSPWLGKYKLFATKRDYQKRLIAEIHNGITRVVDEKSFDKMMKRAASNVTKTVTEPVGKQEIIADHIKIICGDMEGKYQTECAETLCKRLGLTWKNAIDSWSSNEPLTKVPEDMQQCLDHVAKKEGPWQTLLQRFTE